MKKVIVLQATVFVFFCFSLSAFGAADNKTAGQGAIAKGRGGTGMTDVVGGFFNPANQSSRNFVQFGTEGIWADLEYTEYSGVKHDSETGKYFIPSAGLSYVSDGFGMFLGTETPYAFGSRFEDDFDSMAKLSLTEVIASASYRISDFLSVGAGAKRSYGQIELKSPQVINGINVGNAHTEGTGWGNSFNIGISGKLLPNMSYGLSYQTETKTEMDGHTRLYSPLFGNLSDGFNADFYYPARLGAGIKFDLQEASLFFDYIYFDESQRDNVELDYDSVLPDTKMNLDYKNSTYIAIGIEAPIDEELVFRTGVNYQANVIPDKNVSPGTPDMDAMAACIGVSRSFGDLIVDGAISYVNSIDRDVPARTQYPGSYSANLIVMALDFRYNF